MNISSLLAEQASMRPLLPALIEGTGRGITSLTFAALERATAQGAAQLAAQGLQSGDVVLVFLPMGIDLYVALGALFRLGLTAMFIDPAGGRQQIDRCAALVPPRGLIATPRAHLLRLLSPALRAIPIQFATGIGVPGASTWRSGGTPSPVPSPYSPDGAAPALITFTSGSTGQPKAIARSHGFLIRQHQVLQESLAPDPGAVVMTALPIFALSHLAAGVTTIIPAGNLRRPAAVQAAPILTQLQTHHVTRLEASPAMLARLADHCEKYGLQLPNLAGVYTGGGPVYPSLLQRWQRLAPKAAIYAVYGSSEAEPIAHVAYSAMTPADQRAAQAGHGLLVGRPVAAIQLRILPDRWGHAVGPFSPEAFDAQCLSPGQAGEIVVSGPHVLSGYLQGRGDTAHKFSVAGTIWHRTGDAGYLDGEGRLWLLGRCEARSVGTAGVVYPFAVEVAAAAHPKVRRAALVAQDGRRLLAVEVQGRSRSLVPELQRQLAWAQLDQVRLVARLPLDRRHNAKIDYPRLRRQLGLLAQTGSGAG